MEQGIFNSTYQSLIESFEKDHLPERSFEDETLLAKRAAAFQVFSRKGFPSIKDEEWRFTNLNRILKQDFSLRPPSISFAKAEESIAGLDACRLVLINGVLAIEQSDVLPEGLIFLDTQAALANPSYSQLLGSIAVDDNNAMLAFNTAFFKNFYVLHVKAKKLIEKPIHLIHKFSEAGSPSIIPYRLLVIAEELSESTLIETFHSDGQASVLASYVSEVQVAQSAVLHTHLINAAAEDLNLIHHREVEQFKTSVYNNSNLALGNAAFIRNNFNCRLKGSVTETNLLGSYITNGTQHVDNHTVVDHQMPNSNSMELYKGIMMDRSHGVFNGKIFVRLDAQKTNAFQQNNNILLSDQATINSKPQLEIFADDVKCSHGSTVGQIDEQALFYLKTRGISEERARKMLIEAFVLDVHSRIPIKALQEYVLQLLQAKLDTDSLVTA
ncbi:Fe-S cluster assembly protein SufD [Pedobacter sp. SYSU D00535]|uniref:Fe-S cluster assembly protein SufD n=1 Tax=Pedobacter sp. SYSU D00535 TaxID=2810308 RepID=UPI001A9671FB|nr:Fe-S cluster assembly protein SufD [Pedobacter sp. SYSU D00535]